MTYGLVMRGARATFFTRWLRQKWSIDSIGERAVGMGDIGRETAIGIDGVDQGSRWAA